MSVNYETSGVNIKTGNDFIDVIKDITKNEIIGGFSGIYEHNNLKLVASTDGVGRFYFSNNGYTVINGNNTIYCTDNYL